MAAVNANTSLVIAVLLVCTALLGFSLGVVWVGGQTKLTHRLRKSLERVPKCAPTGDITARLPSSHLTLVCILRQSCTTRLWYAG